MYAFSYRKAHSLTEAARQLAAFPEAKLLAGGQTLLPTLKQRLAQPDSLIDIGAVGELQGIEHDGRSVAIGAGVTHAEVAASDVVQRTVPALADLAGHIGDPHVRHRGTIGGSLANNDPAADYPAAALGLAATITTNKREIAADDFFDGLFSTVLEDDEIITKIAFPRPEAAGYAKFPNPASRYALVGVMVAKTLGGVRVAVTGAGADGVFRASAIEQALAANWSADAVADGAVQAGDMLSDIHGSAEYRAHLVSVMTRRALANAA